MSHPTDTWHKLKDTSITFKGKTHHPRTKYYTKLRQKTQTNDKNSPNSGYLQSTAPISYTNSCKTAQLHKLKQHSLSSSSTFMNTSLILISNLQRQFPYENTEWLFVVIVHYLLVLEALSERAGGKEAFVWLSLTYYKQEWALEWLSLIYYKQEWALMWLSLIYYKQECSFLFSFSIARTKLLDKICIWWVY